MEATTRKRRNFLLTLGLGAVAAVAAVLVRKPPEVAAQPETTAAEPVPAKGYHVSEHVKRYYRTTRV